MHARSISLLVGVLCVAAGLLLLLSGHKLEFALLSFVGATLMRFGTSSAINQFSPEAAQRKKLRTIGYAFIASVAGWIAIAYLAIDVRTLVGMDVFLGVGLVLLCTGGFFLFRADTIGAIEIWRRFTNSR